MQYETREPYRKSVGGIPRLGIWAVGRIAYCNDSDAVPTEQSLPQKLIFPHRAMCRSDHRNEDGDCKSTRRNQRYTYARIQLKTQLR